MGMAGDLWRFRGFVLGSIRRDVQAQFRGSVLGAAWLVLQPLSMILIYTLVFSQVMHSRLPGVASTWGYSLYLCAGLLPWTFFADALTRMQGSFTAHAHLIRKASFPRICLPVIAVGGAAFSFGISALLFTGFLLLSGRFPGLALLAVLPALAVQLLLTAALGVLAATLHVFFRDVGPMLQMGLTFWFWLTPIVYPVSALPQAAQSAMAWNPFAVIAHHYQHVVLHGQVPAAAAWPPLAGVAALALVLAALAWRLFRSRAADMADEL